MGDDKDNQEGIGFSGISSLLPDDPPDAAAQQPAQADHLDGSQSAAVPPASGTAGSTPAKPPASALQPKQSVPQPRSSVGGAVWAWIGGIAVVIFVIWAASQSGTQPSGQSAYQPPVAQPDSTQPPAQGSSDQGSSPSATAAQSGVPDLQTPPISSGNVYSVAEIRYCLVLKQWVEAAQPVVDSYNQDQVDRFNRMVNDYNGRCHDFRYQTGDLEQAQRDIAPYAQRFQTLSRQWVQYGETPATNAQPPVAQAATSTMVGDAQRALNTLGYNVGISDGVVGAKTRSAIKSFQRESGLPANGLITAGLVEQMQAAAASHPRQSKEQSGEASTPSETQAPVAAAVDSDRGSAATPTFVHAHELGDCAPTYPVEAARLGQSGTVNLVVRVGSDGGVTAVQIVSSSGSSALDSAAVSAMEQCRFAPAVRNGQPVVDKLELPVSFTWGG